MTHHGQLFLKRQLCQDSLSIAALFGTKALFDKSLSAPIFFNGDDQRQSYHVQILPPLHALLLGNIHFSPQITATMNKGQEKEEMMMIALAVAVVQDLELLRVFLSKRQNSCHTLCATCTLLGRAMGLLGGSKVLVAEPMKKYGGLMAEKLNVAENAGVKSAP
ncbi:hypothetical protein P7K49_029045 [Saguinus oedipus]|uniref:Uncharacterized protein n=1 Tax=Saguinus oedipus TaxID=9490 RepID=A0ABQ9U636_SAGOE|nr:hypothetical protein P7K49_029045 [Saguinus oedipus]